MHKYCILIFLLLHLSPINLIQGQELIKEVFKTHDDGSPEIVHYYQGDKRQSSKVKTDKLDQNARLIEQQHFRNGKLEGTQRTWTYLDNKALLIQEKNYHSGWLDGPQIKHSYSGILQEHFIYKMGKPEGKQLQYFDKNRPKFALHYHNGKPEGLQKEWFRSGQMMYEVYFKNGQPNGLHRIWNNYGEVMELDWKDGQLIEDFEKNNQKHQNAYLFDLDTGNLSLDYNYFNSSDFKTLYKTTSFYENGQAATQQIHHNKKAYKAWHPNGQIKLEGDGKIYERLGRWLAYHSTGQKASEGSFERNRKIDLWTYWNEKGWKICEETYDRSRISEKKFFGYYQDGKKESVGYLLAGSGYRFERKDKTWEYWYPNGRKKRKETYEPGRYSGNRPLLKSFKEWFPTGQVKLEGSDRKAVQFFYDSTGNITAKMDLTFKKTRGLHAYVEEGIQKINTNYTANKGGGNIFNYVFEEGFATQLIIFHSPDIPMKTYRFCIDCPIDLKKPLHGIQEGWDETGQLQYQFNFEDGCLVGPQKEWREDGSLLYSNNYVFNPKIRNAEEQCLTYCGNGSYYTSQGNEIRYEHEWDVKSYLRAAEAKDFSQLKAKEKSKKVQEIEAVSILPKFLETGFD